MKKLLALLMTLTMLVSCVVCLSVSSSAAVEYVEEYYYLQDCMDAYGSHETDADGNLTAEPMFGNGVWAYEWFNNSEGTFHAMSAYLKTADPGWAGGNTWTNFYTPYESALWAEDPATYCMIIDNGRRMHPGNGASPVVSYVAPANGTISYKASIWSTGDGNQSTAEGNDGVRISLFLNDTRVWPSADEGMQLFYDTNSETDPLVVEYPSLTVKAGDRVRFVVSCLHRGGKNTRFVDMPSVTWLTADVPIGNPKGTAPKNILTKDLTPEGCTVTWEATKNAAGYNVYVDGKKVNDSLVTGTEYVITGLEARKLYEVTITTYTTSGSESDPSIAQSFRTKNAGTVVNPPAGGGNENPGENSGGSSDDPITNTGSEGSITDTVDSNVTNDGEGVISTDTASDKTTDKTTNKKTDKDTTGTDEGAGKGTSKKSTKKTTTDKPFPWWIVIVAAAVVVLAAVAVVVFLVIKKKNAAEALPEDAPAETDAPTEE